MSKRTIIYTQEQVRAMDAVEDLGVELHFARVAVDEATAAAKDAVRHALLLGIHYKELKGLNESFTYRVLKDIEREAA